MSIHKIRSIVNHINLQGKLPTDSYGQLLSVDKKIGWFGLTDRLDREEFSLIKKELSAMVEAELLSLELETESI